MKILGIDESSRAGTVLKTELKKIGFRLSELEFIQEIPEEGEMFVLALGAEAVKQACGPVAMAEVSGEILPCLHNPDALVIPNYAPGFLYHNPNMKGLWLDNLKLARVAYELNEKGVIV